MKPQLTSRQRQALEFVTACLDQHGYPPTLREIGEHMGIGSTNGVNDHLRALERKGYIVREDLKSRTLRPANFSDGHVHVPIVGQVAAGEPMLAEENIVDRVAVDRYFLGAVKGKDVFGLVVRGESMIEDGIHDGDYVFVRKQSTAERGEIVVVMIDGEATCKRFFPEGDKIRLQPANSAMEPIYLRRSDFRAVDLLGRVVGVYRRLN